MTYKQVKGFNQSTAGKVKGYCLQNVRKGYGIASKYPTAIAAWQNTQQHTDRGFPIGIDVPLFYTFGKDGHVNVLLTNGTLWSDGTIYKNLESYLTSHTSVKYLGWGETLNNVRVIEYVADSKPAPSLGKRLYFDPIGQTATFYPVKGGTFKMHIKDSSYNWNILENQGYRVRVNSASAGGDCWVYMIWQTGTDKGKAVPGRYIK